MTDDSILKSDIPKVQQAFRELSPKELDTIPARAAIKQMRRQIERVLRLGYTYEEVSATLASFDIHISAERVKYLLNDIRKESRKKSKAKHKPEEDSFSMVENVDERADSTVTSTADESAELTVTLTDDESAELTVTLTNDESVDSSVKPPIKTNGSRTKKTQPQPHQSTGDNKRASIPNSKDNSSNNFTEQSKDNSTNNPTEKLTNNSTSNATNNSTDKLTNNSTSNPTNNPTDKSTNNSASNPTNNFTNKSTNNSTNKSTNNSTDNQSAKFQPQLILDEDL